MLTQVVGVEVKIEECVCFSGQSALASCRKKIRKQKELYKIHSLKHHIHIQVQAVCVGGHIAYPMVITS